MRPFRPGFILFALAWFSAPAFAQQAATTGTSDPQAVAIIQRSLVALTSGAPVSDVTLTGTVHRIAGSDDETGTATLKATALGDSRVDLSFPSGKRSEIRNHSAIPLPGVFPVNLPPAMSQAAATAQPVGAWSGPNGSLHGMANHNTITDAAWFFPAATLTVIVSSQGFVLSYVGQEPLDGQSALHVSVQRQSTIPSTTDGSAPSALPGPAGTSLAALAQHLSQMDVYLDPTTSLPVALAFFTHPDSNALVDIPIRVEFSNYQSVNGVQIPFHVQRYLNNSLDLELQVTSANLNSGLAAVSFQLQ